jgi:ATP-dependent DNA helicase RecG
LSGVRSVRLRNGKFLYKLEATDGQSFADIIFFNSKYTAESLDMGNEYLFRGNVTGNLLKFEIVSPKIKKNDDNFKFYPVYRQTKGISSAKITSLVKSALELLPSCIPETLPEKILKSNDLCSLDFALKNIHFPTDRFALSAARKRIIFEELFIYQLSMCQIKKQARQKTEVKITKDYSKEFCESLPFKITSSQENVIRECTRDIKESGFSMNRLLQGDVGSGKTVIAAALAYNMVRSGYQVAVMAPTEILATQHYRTFSDFFEPFGVKVQLLYGSMKAKEKRFSQNEIELGAAQIVIGTHSLLSDNIVFKNLGLIVTDEQHRFGVKQRSCLVEKGDVPHVLVMSATPIPRTLAMILYGDLDISVLNETLPGRQKVDTFQVDESKRHRAWAFLRKIIDEGGQGYVVCASIEENENEIADVKSYRDKMVEYGFGDGEIEILHGKMSSSEKDYIMKQFIDGQIKILVSTTVIEVGIDVPNARLIIIENAERFGISQLHQLRGRVGRSSLKSYCILISNSKSRNAARRFNAMTSSGDGFYLSEEDLKIRGPGDFFGVNQHGAPNISIPMGYEDIGLMKQAQESAAEIMSRDPCLSSPELKFIKHKIGKIFLAPSHESGQVVV